MPYAAPGLHKARKAEIARSYRARRKTRARCDREAAADALRDATTFEVFPVIFDQVRPAAKPLRKRRVGCC